MTKIRVTSTAILSLLLGIAAPGYAQQEQQGEKQDHPQQQQSQHEQAKPEQQHAQQPRQPAERQQQAQHAQQQQKQDQNKQTQQRAQQQQKQDENKQTQQHAQQQQQKQDQNKQTQQRSAQQQRGNQRPERTQQQQHVQQSAFQQHRSQNWQSDHRTWQQRGGYNGYRIPDDRYRGYFGRGHGFRIYSLPFLVVGGYPRFQYEGYWISMVDPWPEYWGNDWYDNDDVYVMYVDNGYYLFNQRYPNVGIAINISM